MRAALLHNPCFKTIGDILQLPWVCLSCFNTNFLCFKTVWDKCYVVLCALPRCTNALGSLLSSMEHFHKTYLFIPLVPGRGQILWTEKVTPCAGHFKVVIYRCKNLWKANLKITIQLLKLYLELAIYRCVNNEHTPKNGNKNRKNDESIL